MQALELSRQYFLLCLVFDDANLGFNISGICANNKARIKDNASHENEQANPHPWIGAFQVREHHDGCEGTNTADIAHEPILWKDVSNHIASSLSGQDLKDTGCSDKRKEYDSAYPYY